MDTNQSRFLRACRGQETDRPPVWLMRQAGRYLPEYRATREKAGDFLTLCRTPELATEVTLQPLRRFGFDAAILFSDILIPAVAMGADLSFAEGEGPRIHNPLRSDEDVERLREPEPREACAFVYEAIRQLRRELAGLGDTPLIGFAAAPYTLASYLVEGETSRGFETSRAFLLSDRKRAETLLEKVGRFTARYLLAQAEAGAQALQLFDTWAGLASPADYRELALPAVRTLIGALREALGPEFPLIYFVNGVGSVIEDVARLPGLSVVSVDWRIEFAEARRRAGNVTLQGNLDPAVLLAGPGPTAERARRLLRDGGGRNHIVNLGHGILPRTPLASVEALVEEVRSFRKEGA
jgi:uroporphyrinogen decarboxylase